MTSTRTARRIMRSNHPTTLVALVVIIATAQLEAQESDTTHLGTVVVSASKVPVPATSLTQPVTVIAGDDLRARGVTRVSDALREVPGAMLVQNGSYGSVTSLFLRGGESRYTKVLIDGVPVNAAGGFFDFSHLTTDNIDRIEIVRGPASVLYGADAVSGIVQIFTRKAGDERRASLGARGGTYHSFDIDADAAGSSGPAAISLGAARHSTNGILPFNNANLNGTLSSSVKLERGDAGTATVSARYTAAEFHYPTDFTGAVIDSNSYRVQHRLTVGIDAGRNLASWAQARLLAGTNDVSDLTEDIATPSGAPLPEHSAARSRGYRRSAEARLSLFLPTSATLSLGTGYEREHEHSGNLSAPVGAALSETDSFDASRNNIAYYSELLGNPGQRISYTVSGRVDDNSDYRRFATYRLGANTGLFGMLRLRASLSTAFNAPAFSQLRPTLFTVGSPNLRPERARSAEIGLTTELNPDRIRLSANYFTQRFSDLIQFIDGGPPSFKGSFSNLTGASADGIEGELSLSPTHDWRATASYTVVNPRVTQIPVGFQGTDRVGDALIRRPSHSGALVLTYSRARSVSGSIAVNYVGKRPDVDFSQFPSPRVSLPAYARLDLSADLPIARAARGGLTFNVRIENALNQHYADVFNFPAPGRTLLIGARAAALF
jgi:vitamin B12 transporter